MKTFLELLICAILGVAVSLGAVYLAIESLPEQPVLNDDGSISPPEPWMWVSLPNHINAPESLGLVHEVEKTMDDTTRMNYRCNLQEAILSHPWDNSWIISATSRQRVVAILQTVKPEIFEP